MLILLVWIYGYVSLDMNLNGKFDQTDLDQIKKMRGKYTIEDECLAAPVE